VDRFAHGDWIGSTRYLTDSTGHGVPSALNYDAFGRWMGMSGPEHPSDFLFAGQWGYQSEFDTASDPGLGLQYLQQHYYDPAIGRFISPDPIGSAGGLNLYGYVGNNPVDAVDPSGLIPDRWTSIGHTITYLILTRNWQELAGFLDDAAYYGLPTSVQDLLLQPLYRQLAKSLKFLSDPQYRPSLHGCDRVVAKVNGVLAEQAEPLMGTQLVQVVRVEAQHALHVQRGWFEGLRFWPGRGESIGGAGYHEAVQIGPRVFDSVTGPNGMLLEDWLKRIGAKPSDVLPRWP
jgi:RHS repeat-associated protein